MKDLEIILEIVIIILAIVGIAVQLYINNKKNE